MRVRAIIILLVLSFLSFNTYTAQNTLSKLELMPFPQQIELREGLFRVDDNFLLEYKFIGKRITKASNRFLERLAKKTGMFLVNPFAKEANQTSNQFMFVDIKQEAENKLFSDESYELKIDNNKINLTAQTDIGALRGLETLLQLLSSDSLGYYFPAVQIYDSPRFPWRGLLIDVCRHFMPMDVIIRNLDAMASVKMNVMHLHLSEDQGFRIESKVFPKLHQFGSDGLFYTQNQIKEIINHADELGIRIIPEFDVPGHATAILTAYPELASLPGTYSIERNWGIFDPTLNPIKEETYQFLDDLFKEMSDLFIDEYFHIGGDENNGKQWDANQEIQSFMRENQILDNHALQGYFNNRLLSILTKHGKKMIGWDEIFHPSMPNNIVIQSWRGKEVMIESAKKGYQTILSNGYYIDLIQPTDFHYLNDPLPYDVKLTDEESKFILGGEATMWGEMISEETIDSRIWPRTAAIAERLWSPQNINDVENMYHRLDKISFLLEEHNLTHLKNYEMMLRRLTNNNDIEPLKILVDILEPVKFYNRNRLRKQTQQSPLTRVVDAAKPDSKSARTFNILVDSFLTDKIIDQRKYEQIKNQLIIWKENHNLLSPIIKKSPILFEIELISEMLSKVSSIGLEAIEFIKDGINPNPEWLIEVNNLIEEAKNPIAQTELMIVSGIEKLLNNIPKK